MWFNDPAEILSIAKKNGTSIFVLEDLAVVDIPNALILEPDTKTAITIEQVRKITASLGLKQTTDQFVIIRPADKLSLGAANALLKNLEEPGEHIHYVLLTNVATRIIPTIRSRAAIYFLKPTPGKEMEVSANEKDKEVAKQLIVASPKELIEIAERIAKPKTARADALRLLAITIEILYKSYYVTKKDVFLKKIPRFLTAYENIDKNGHVKLHFVADLC